MNKDYSNKKKFNKHQYEELIATFKDYENLSLADYVQQKCYKNREVLLIRHDIDHDIATARKIAHWEHMKGIVSTYCILHSAEYYGYLLKNKGSYFHTAELLELCRELKTLGHEICLHNNLLVTFLKTGVDPVSLLLNELEFFNEIGIQIRGTSSHGDKLCRILNFRNYELFEEAVSNDYGGKRLLQYEGNITPVGLTRLSDCGLIYEAYDIAFDYYTTDSGGYFRSYKNILPRHNYFTAKQLDAKKTVGILTHPIWWDFD